jgi:hypothetical protein
MQIYGCDSDWQTWWIGSRTQWNITKDFYMGVDVMYSKLQSATICRNATRRRQLHRRQLNPPLCRF